MKKIAVVLFNLGGPDRVESIKPFLFNLFNDPAIINFSNPWRWLLAKFISTRRAPIAAKIYQHLGGKSPLLEMTQDQARALELHLSQDFEVKTFIAMRYWHPMSDETIKKVAAFNPDEVILLPLYPQFSMTSSGSSINDWHRAAKQSEFHIPTKTICCYPTDSNWVSAVSSLINQTLKHAKAEHHRNIRILFSAHGIPQKMIDRGDPYQNQVEKTCLAVIDFLDSEANYDSLDWKVCYQSKVGRLKWIGPSLGEEIERAAVDNIAVCIVPIAFVSEHSETLVELDIEYRQMADNLKVPGYFRVPTVGISKQFISGLSEMIRQVVFSDRIISSGNADNSCICANKYNQCPIINFPSD